MGTENHRQLLIHSKVYNQAGHTSERFIDQQIFSLWECLMSHHHGFAVATQQACVWVPQAERQRHQQVFDRVKHSQAVSRLAFECYDQDSGISQTKVRFVPREEQDQLVDLLMSHLGGAQEFTTLTVAEGEALSNDQRGLREPGYNAPSWSMPRGFAPVRSAIRS